MTKNPVCKINQELVTKYKFKMYGFEKASTNYKKNGLLDAMIGWSVFYSEISDNSQVRVCVYRGGVYVCLQLCYHVCVCVCVCVCLLTHIY